MKTVAVFFGGRSNEREISVITGVYCVNLLREEYRVFPVYLRPEGGLLLMEDLSGVESFRLAQEKNFKGYAEIVLTAGGFARVKRPKRITPIDCALNCCHGGMGEGGTLSALLEWFRIPSASPDMTSSAVFLDKVCSKYLLKGMGIPVLPSFAVSQGEFNLGDWRESAGSLGYPLIVKPSRLGSSVGISVARDEAELEQALALAFTLDRSALVEKYLGGKRDLNIAAYRVKEQILCSPIEEVFSSSPILTFGEKYEGAGERRHELPAQLPEATAQKIEGTLREIYARFNMRGVVRADFLLSKEGEVYFNELNTVPGTLATYLFGESLTEARALLSLLVEEGTCALPEKQVLETGILSAPVFGVKSAKRRGPSA